MSTETINAFVHSMSLASTTSICFELRSSETPLPEFTPGSHIDVHVAPGIVRQYSLCNSPDERHRYQVCVHRNDLGRGGSRAMHSTVRVGQQIRISHPRNSFGLDNATKYILVAGGIGVTPLLAMAHHLLAEDARFELHVYARDSAHTPLADVLREQSQRDHVHIHLSSDGDSMRLLPPTALTTRSPGTLIYTCGPEGFMDAVATYASAGGFSSDQIRRERFAPAPPHMSDADPATSFDVIVASTGQRLTVAPHERIADVLVDAGVEVEMSCEQGMCGACLTGVLAGIPDHRDDVQSDAERASNTHLTVCCSRSRTSELVLDL